MPDVTSDLQAESIIPDILAAGTIVPRNLRVEFPNARLEKPGQMIDREATQPKPSVFVDPPPENADSSAVYTLMMVDPDLTHRHDTKFGQVRHWLVTQCSIGSTGEVLDPKNTTISPWVGPAPIPAHYVLGKPHPSRYTFILCRQKENTPSPKFAPDSLRQHYEGSPGELGKASQDIIDRMKFNTQHFIDQNHMEVVAASFMLVEGNMKSGFENAALTATAMAHKIVGK